MNTKAEIQDFLAQKTVAVVGLSRDEKSSSAGVNRELRSKGYRTIPVNPNARQIGGDTCYPRLSAIPEKVDAALVFTPPSASEEVVRDAAAAGITRVWLQLGAQSDAAVAAATEKRMALVSGKCILMFAEPVSSIHSVHRWFAKVFGQLPR